jgi:hypothetical protein
MDSGTARLTAQASEPAQTEALPADVREALIEAWARIFEAELRAILTLRSEPPWGPNRD